MSAVPNKRDMHDLRDQYKLLMTQKKTNPKQMQSERIMPYTHSFVETSPSQNKKFFFQANSSFYNKNKYLSDRSQNNSTSNDQSRNKGGLEKKVQQYQYERKILESLIQKKELYEKEAQEKIEICYHVNEYLQKQLDEKAKIIRKLQQEKVPRQQNIQLNQSNPYLNVHHPQETRDNAVKRLQRNQTNFFSNSKINTLLKKDTSPINNKYTQLQKDFENLQKENKDLKLEVARYQIILQDQIQIFDELLNQQIDEDQIVQATKTIVQANLKSQQKPKIKNLSISVNIEAVRANLVVIEYLLKTVNQQAKLVANDEFLLYQMINQAKQNIQLSQDDQLAQVFQQIIEQIDNFNIIQEIDFKKDPSKNNDLEEENQLLKNEIEILQLALSDTQSNDIQISSADLTLTSLINNFWSLTVKEDLSCFSNYLGVLSFDSAELSKINSIVFQNPESLKSGIAYLKNMNNYSLLSLLLNQYQITKQEDVSENYQDQNSWNEFWIKFLVDNSAMIIFVAKNIGYREVQFLQYLKKIGAKNKKVQILVLTNKEESIKGEFTIVNYNEMTNIKKTLKNYENSLKSEGTNFLSQLKNFILTNCRYFFQIYEDDTPNFLLKEKNKYCSELTFQVNSNQMTPQRQFKYDELDPLNIFITDQKIQISYKNLKRILIQNQLIEENSLFVSLICQNENCNYERNISIQKENMNEQFQVQYQENSIIFTY